MTHHAQLILPLVLLIGGVALAPAAAPDAPVLTVNLTGITWQPLQQNVLGINCELLPQLINFTHPAFMRRYQELGRPIIRYPGGTSANYYNPLTGFLVEAPGFSRIGIQNQRIHTKTAGRGDDYRHFFRFVQASDAPYSVTLNVTTMTLADTTRWLEDLAAQKIAPRYFEIGNELFYHQYAELMPDGKEYARRAEAVTKVIRRLFPEAKVAVIAPDSYGDEVYLDETKPRRPAPQRYAQWLAALRDKTFYDAVAIHAYSGYGMKPDTQPADFWPLEKSYHFAISQQDCQLGPCLDEAKRQFPGRPIWMTEYDLGGWSPTLREYPLAVGYLGSLHSSAMLLKLAGRPEVAMANRNTFVAFLKWTGGGPLKDGLYAEDFPFEPNILYKHFQLVGRAIRAGDRFGAPSLDGVVSYAGAAPYRKKFPEVEAGVFRKQDRGYLILINKLNRTYQLGGIAGAQAAETIQYSPRQDVPFSQAVAERYEMRETTWPAPPAKLTLPPYSLTCIALTLEKDR